MTDDTSLLNALASISTLPATDPVAIVNAYLALSTRSTGMRTAYMARLSGDALQLVQMVNLPGGCIIDPTRTTPLHETFCQYVRATGSVVVIEDAAQDARVAQVATREAARIGAYIGVPLTRSNGTLYGTLCVVDPDPQVLTASHVALLRFIASQLIPFLAEPPPISLSPRAVASSLPDHLPLVAQTVAHDARSPVMVIVGNADLLALDPLTPGQEESLAAIRQSATLLTRLLNDLHEAAHNQQSFTLLTGQVDTVALAQQLVSAWFDQAQRQGLALSVEVAPNAPALIKGDAHRIQQVLINLLSNALRYTLQGQVRLVVASCVGGGVEFRVEDTGPGIPEELQSLIWEREVRGTTSHTGSGLGLAIVRQLVAAMGGTCGVESVVGQGSTFWVRLPLEGPPPRPVPW